jgi:membrane associated rhomboid family serine protease
MIPYSCDALLYHLPICTGALIAINLFTFGAAISGSLDPFDGWILEYGSGLQPKQWLLSPFMHAGYEHLLGNMFFLWTFGLVTEGKLGWWRFLLAYFGIAVGQCALEQAVMPHFADPESFTLGASAAIYGLVAMAVVWAPINEISIFVILFFRFFTFEMMLGVFAILYVGIDLVTCLLLGTGALGSFAHLMGGAMGFALGIILLRTRQVECEDTDLLSVLSGTYGADKQKEREKAAVSPERTAAFVAGKALENQRRFNAYLEIDQPNQAMALKKKAAHLGQPLTLERKDLLRLIAGLHKQKLWKDSAPVMAELIERFPADSQAVRLKLAQICFVEFEKPARTLELLEGLNGVTLPPPQETLRTKLRAAAQRKIDEGAIEVDDGSW